MSNLTLLTKEQCHKLEVLKKKEGANAEVTDFAYLLTEYVDEFPGVYWIKSGDIATQKGFTSIWDVPSIPCFYGRPVLPLSSSDIQMKGSRNPSDGVLEVMYGYYPQKKKKKKIQETLEEAYNNNILPVTGMEYTTDTPRKGIEDIERGFIPKHHKVYELDEMRYVRLEVNIIGKDSIRLSNEESYNNGDPVWIEVSPVKWLVDEKAGIMLTDNLIFSGVQFNNDRNNRDFDSSTIKAFMDKYLSKELEQGRSTLINQNNNKRRESEEIEKENEDAKKKEVLIARIRAAKEEGRILDEKIAKVREKSKSVK